MKFPPFGRSANCNRVPAAFELARALEKRPPCSTNQALVSALALTPALVPVLTLALALALSSALVLELEVGLVVSLLAMPVRVGGGTFCVCVVSASGVGV